MNGRTMGDEDLIDEEQKNDAVAAEVPTRI